MSLSRVLVLSVALAALSACKKEAPPPAPAAPPPPVAAAETPAPAPLAELAPMEAPDAAPPPPVAPAKPQSAASAIAANVARCCSALKVEATRQAGTVEGGMMAGAAAQCTAIAGQVSKNPNAPELTVLRNLLQGRPVPAVCKF